MGLTAVIFAFRKYCVGMFTKKIEINYADKNCPYEGKTC